MELKQFIKDLAAKLQAAGIDYCITGGYAVSVWGAPRSTLGIDFITGLKVDFWVVNDSNKTGLKELKRKKREVFEGQEIFFVSPEDLILSKLRRARLGSSSRHAEDIRSVIGVSGKNLDLEYLKREAALQELGADLSVFL